MTVDHSGETLKSEITPYRMYMNRRSLLKAAGGFGSAALTAGLYRYFNPVQRMELQTEAVNGISHTLSDQERLSSGFLIEEEPTPVSSIISYNNFYEFTTDKNAVASVAKDFDTKGWQIEVGGLVKSPHTFSMNELKQVGPIEERIYRMRCVEAWSMVIPWIGIQLSHLLAAVQPTSQARYVAFETLYDPNRMPGQKTKVLEWPYVEGLRLDEAMHPLSILAIGLYGQELPPQDGAPVRLVVPWKYGFKGIKSIVKITLTDMEPATSWNRYAPNEYGFLANVNPAVAHPRWSQATEQRIGESGRRQTLPFNGYADQVAELYKGIDLTKHF